MSPEEKFYPGTKLLLEFKQHRIEQCERSMRRSTYMIFALAGFIAFSITYHHFDKQWAVEKATAACVVSK